MRGDSDVVSKNKPVLRVTSLDIYTEMLEEAFPKSIVLDGGPAFTYFKKLLGKTRTLKAQKDARILLKECKETPHVSDELRDEALRSITFALRASLQYAQVRLKDVFDESMSESKRRSAYIEVRSALDFSSDALHRIRTRPEFEGTLDLSQKDECFRSIKACEQMQRQLFTSVVDQLVVHRISSGTISEGGISLDFQERSDRNRIDIVTRIILEVIRDVNPRPEHHPKPHDVSDGTIDVDQRGESASDRSENCTRVVPATIATLWGSKAVAAAGLDDTMFDEIIIQHWERIYQEQYGGSFESLPRAEHLFARLQFSPNDHLGVLYYEHNRVVLDEQERFIRPAHVTVAGKIGGVVCIIEGQTASIITQDPAGHFQQHSLDSEGNIHVSRVDSEDMRNPRYLPVKKVTDCTEFERGSDVTAAFHERIPDLSTIRLLEGPLDIDLTGPLNIRLGEPRGPSTSEHSHLGNVR